VVRVREARKERHSGETEESRDAKANPYHTGSYGARFFTRSEL
jgi:hypothetical protein